MEKVDLSDARHHLKLVDLTKIYPHPYNSRVMTPVIVGVTLDVDSSQVNYLVGPSGSGKTTLLNILRGVLDFDAGDVYFDGKSLASMTVTQKMSYYRQVAYINQHPRLNLDFNLNLEENLKLALYLRGNHQQLRLLNAEKRIDTIMEQLNLKKSMKKQPLWSFSGGELQRAALARAMIVPPDLLLLDEPTSQLDSDNAASIIDLVLDINQKNHSLVILATHDLSLVQKGRVIRLVRGRSHIFQNYSQTT